MKLEKEITLRLPIKPSNCSTTWEFDPDSESIILTFKSLVSKAEVIEEIDILPVLDNCSKFARKEYIDSYKEDYELFFENEKKLITLAIKEIIKDYEFRAYPIEVFQDLKENEKVEHFIAALQFSDYQKRLNNPTYINLILDYVYYGKDLPHYFPKNLIPFCEYFKEYSIDVENGYVDIEYNEERQEISYLKFGSTQRQTLRANKIDMLFELGYEIDENDFVIYNGDAIEYKYLIFNNIDLANYVEAQLFVEAI